MRLFEFDTDNDPIHLPDDVAQAFSDMGDEQRGLPEIAMRKAQTLLGGGVLSFCLEHVGDLTHRMAHHAKYGSFYPGIVRDKVEKTLRVLTNGYGFEKEHQENMRANISYRTEKDPNFDVDAWKAALEAALATYAAEHKKLPVYNETQWFARQAAIALGKKDWKQTIRVLSRLKEISVDDQEFAKAASEYVLNDQGNLTAYRI